MKDEKILENEILTDEQLEQIVGGSWEEYKDIAKLLPKVRYWYQSYTTKSRWIDRDMDPDEVRKYLNETYNVDASISAYTLFGNYSNVKNKYSRDGVSMTHAEVLDLIKASK